MATYDEPIIVKIINDANAAMSGGGGGGVKTAAGLSATFNVLQDIYGLVKEAVAGVLRPVVSVVKGVLKLLAQFLRPAIDILLILLMPLLMMLKPLIKVFNEIMRPFRQIAFDMIKKGGQTALIPAMSVITMGFNAAIMNVVGQMIKTALVMVASLFEKVFHVSGLVQFISETADGVLQGYNDLMLTSAKTVQSSFENMLDIIDFVNPLNKVGERFQKSVNEMLNQINFTKKTSNRAFGVNEATGNMVIGISPGEITQRSNATAKKYGIDLNSKETAADVFNRLRNG